MTVESTPPEKFRPHWSYWAATTAVVIGLPLFINGAGLHWRALGRSEGALSAETIDSFKTALLMQAVGVVLLFAAVGQLLTFLKRR